MSSLSNCLVNASSQDLGHAPSKFPPLLGDLDSGRPVRLVPNVNLDSQPSKPDDASKSAAEPAAVEPAGKERFVADIKYPTSVNQKNHSEMEHVLEELANQLGTVTYGGANGQAYSEDIGAPIVGRDVPPLPDDEPFVCYFFDEPAVPAQIPEEEIFPAWEKELPYAERVKLTQMANRRASMSSAPEPSTAWPILKKPRLDSPQNLARAGSQPRKPGNGSTSVAESASIGNVEKKGFLADIKYLISANEKSQADIDRLLDTI